jgi:hypothetical protein
MKYLSNECSHEKASAGGYFTFIAGEGLVIYHHNFVWSTLGVGYSKAEALTDAMTSLSQFELIGLMEFAGQA